MVDLIGAIKDAIIHDTTPQDITTLVTLLGLFLLLLS